MSVESCDFGKNFDDEMDILPEDWDRFCESLIDDDIIALIKNCGQQPRYENIVDDKRIGSQEILKYAKLIENGINSHCPVQLNEAFEACCTEDVIYLVYFPKHNTFSHSFRHISGRQASVNYVHMNFSTSPDCLFLIHQQEIVLDDNGNKSVKCKNTVNGTALFSLQFGQNGDRLPDPVTSKQMRDKIQYLILMKKHNKDTIAQKKKKEQQNAEEQQRKVDGEEDDHFISQSANIAFKKKDCNMSKFNRYRSGDTVGAYVEYDAFTEGNLKNYKKKLSDAQTEEHCDSHQMSNKAYSTLTDAQRMQLYAAEIASRYTEDQKFYGDECSSYSLSEMFAMPVPLNGKGIMTLHIDKNNKICMIEHMVYLKPL